MTLWPLLRRSIAITFYSFGAVHLLLLPDGYAWGIMLTGMVLSPFVGLTFGLLTACIVASFQSALRQRRLWRLVLMVLGCVVFCNSLVIELAFWDGHPDVNAIHPAPALIPLIFSEAYSYLLFIPVILGALAGLRISHWIENTADARLEIYRPYSQRVFLGLLPALYIGLSLCLLSIGWRTGYQTNLDAQLLSTANGDNFYEDASQIPYLLNRGAHVDAMDYQGDTALSCEVSNNNTDAVRVLLEHGANPNPKGELSRGSSLAWAANEGNWDIVRMLLSHGADPNGIGVWGWTPLMQATQAGNVEAMKDLIRCGANVNTRSGDGSTALMMAAEMNKPKVSVINVLLQAGANTSIRNESGKTALLIAKEYQRYGNFPPSESKPIQRAAKQERDSIVLALKRSGATE